MLLIKCQHKSQRGQSVKEMQNRLKSTLGIRLFGVLSMVDSHGNVIPLAGRKDRALVAYLAANVGKPVARDRLIELIWPGAAEGSGRASLRQSLSTIRKALPEEARGAFSADRDTICLDADRVTTDLGALEDSQQDPKALPSSETSWDGSFLDGLAGISSEFDVWRTTEQARFTTLAIQFLKCAAEKAESEQHFSDAARALTQVLALDPLAEEPSRSLMQAYVALGRPEAALRQYRSLEILLESELGVQPEKRTQDLVREIRTKRNRIDPESLTLLEPGLGSPLERPAVLVSPFFEGGEAVDYFAASFTESVILALSRFQETPVFDLKSAKAASAAHGGEPLEMAGTLGAGFVLSGAIRRGDGRLRVNARLTEVASGRTVWAEKFDGTSGDILDFEDEISARVATAIAGRIENEAQRRARGKSLSNLNVIDLVMRGRYHLNLYTKSGEDSAKECFEEALKLDPECVPAMAGLAISHLHDFGSTSPDAPHENLKIARELAQRALELDDCDSQAQYAMANSMCYLGGYDLAQEHCNRALETNPNDYHNICTLGWILTFSGKIDDGIACNSKAISLNPYAPSGCLMVSGFGLIVKGDFEGAIKKLSGIRAENMFKHGALAACYSLLGRPGEADLATQAFRDLAEQDFPGDGNCGFTRTSEYWRRQFHFAREKDANRFFGAMNSAGIPV
jgi:DNA-binding SARP family transcriptional activator